MVKKLPRLGRGREGTLSIGRAGHTSLFSKSLKWVPALPMFSLNSEKCQKIIGF